MVTCWERADLLALVGDVYCIFATFPCVILSQVGHLIVSFPDLYLLSYVASKKLDVTVFAERRGQMSLFNCTPFLKCQFFLSNFKIIKDKAHLRQGG